LLFRNYFLVAFFNGKKKTMERIMIIGCGGAGKSTLSKKLSQLTGLELIHLDRHYWKPNWEMTDKPAWETLVRELSNRPSWIIDGNYGSTMDIRIAKADTIIFLDYSTLVCLWRVTKRTLQYWRKSRPDMSEGCGERFDWQFYHYVATYNSTRRKKILAKLDKVKDSKKVLIFNNDKETDNFLKELEDSIAK